MAQKRPRRGQPRGPSDDETARNPAAGKEWPPKKEARSAEAGPAPAAREIRPYIYAGLDLAMAVVYSLVLIQSPTRHARHAILLWSAVGAMVLAAAGMLWRSRWGWRIAAAACGLVLLLAVVILVLILLSASFLAGVYGSMGRGAASIALLAGALVIELVGLVPAFQLKFLRTRAGRRHFGVGAARNPEPPR